MARRGPAQVAEGQASFGFDVDRGAGTEAQRTRRSTPRAGERDLSYRPQTRLKLDSLAAYLPRWFNIAALNAQESFYIDAFAGAGSYPDADAVAAGSPVIACRAALGAVEQSRRRGHDWTPHLRFVERNQTTVAELRRALHSFDGALDYEVVGADAAQEIPRLLAEASHRPTLLFADPDGYAPVSFAWFRALGTGVILTEALVSIDAQAIIRAHRRGETGALTAFAGGEWWMSCVGADGQIELGEFFRLYVSRLAGKNAPFPYASVEHLEFLSNHARRAIVQCCMSFVGLKLWREAMTRSREKTRVIASFFPELDEHALVDTMIQRLAALSGRERLRFRDLLNALEDCPPDEKALRQTLLFLQEKGLASWTTRLEASARPWFRLESDWPKSIVWDGEHRREDRTRALVGVTPGR